MRGPRTSSPERGAEIVLSKCSGVCTGRGVCFAVPRADLSGFAWELDAAVLDMGDWLLVAWLLGSVCAAIHGCTKCVADGDDGAAACTFVLKYAAVCPGGQLDGG